MKKLNAKTCSCGAVHFVIPSFARYQSKADTFDFLAGWYWECECQSTLFEPETKSDWIK